MEKEYKTRQDWVGKVIHWELCKELKFDHTTKWYMHKTVLVLENTTHKILCNFKIAKNPRIPTRKPDSDSLQKWNLLSSGPKSENQRKRKEKHVLRPCQRNKKCIEHESDGDTNCNWWAWNDFQRLDKGSRRVGIQKKTSEHQTTALLRLARTLKRVTRKNHPQTLMWNLARNNNNNNSNKDLVLTHHGFRICFYLFAPLNIGPVLKYCYFYYHDYRWRTCIFDCGCVRGRLVRKLYTPANTV